MKIAVIQYNAGNIQSVKNSLIRIGINPLITNNPEIIKSADKVIFPGVGEAGSAMNYLRNNNLDLLIKQLKQPVLGICLGMQLLCAFSEESNTQCIGVFPGKVRKFSGNMKIPQVGWNTVTNLKTNLFNGLSENSFMYFVHSYYVEINEFTIAETNYFGSFASAISFNNFYGCQFHPEKSSEAGEKIIKNFLEII